ncbi:hypothetical protein [Shigella phage ESh22]|nr:hypothetical protein [Shigella phage ESh21]URY12801.1 hypothetical protein [Shigella phage ESh22]
MVVLNDKRIFIDNTNRFDYTRILFRITLHTLCRK